MFVSRKQQAERRPEFWLPSYTDRALATMWGVSESRVRKWRRAAGVKPSHAGKPCTGTCRETGASMSFPTMCAAARHVGVDESAVRRVLRGRAKTAGGWTWVLTADPDPAPAKEAQP